MEHQWRIRRAMHERSDGQAKWDMAYQCLLKWAQATRNTQTQEGQDESSHIRPCVNVRAGREADY